MVRLQLIPWSRRILDSELVKESQREDHVLKQVRDWLTTGHQPTKEKLRGQDEETQAWCW